jgi:hypothetical protein
MESSQQTETTTTETQVTEKEVTLDDVYRESGLDKETPQTQAQPQQPQERTRVEPSSIPDPYDTENFKAWAARQAAGTTELERTVRQLTGFLNKQVQDQAINATRADIDKAVQAIDEKVSLGKPKVIEAYLDGMVREDPRMKALWDNRSKNPVAWGNALKIAANKMAEEFSVKVDPSLVAAQRARKEAQRQMATTAPEPDNPAEDRLAKAQGQDFDVEWQRLVSGG